MKRPLPITAREADVLRLIILGQSNSSIAFLLAVPIEQVEAHRGELVRKFHVGTFLKQLRRNFGNQQTRRVLAMSRQGAASPSLPAVCAG